MSTYQFDSYSRLRSTQKEGRVYALCIFLRNRRSELENVRLVEYTLHRSFRNPVRVVRHLDHCFALESEAWGGFEVNIRLMTLKPMPTDNPYELRHVYELKVSEDAWPRGEKPSSLPSESQRIYDTLLDKRWEWRKLNSISNTAKVEQAEARHILESLAEANVVRKAYFTSANNEDFWGATFRVGLLPIPIPES